MIRLFKFPVILILFLYACLGNKRTAATLPPVNDIYLVGLGITQDGGYPHAGCRRDCCRLVYEGKRSPQSPVCLGLVDREAGKVFMIEATPEFAEQWRRLQDIAGCQNKPTPDGIFITHAHIGHYSGLMQLGREVMGAKNVNHVAFRHAAPDGKKKVTFIHFNHTNPLLWEEKTKGEVRKAGFSIAEENMLIPL